MYVKFWEQLLLLLGWRSIKLVSRSVYLLVRYWFVYGLVVFILTDHLGMRYLSDVYRICLQLIR